MRFSFLFLLPFIGYSQIDFLSNWEDAQHRAKASDQIRFVFGYTTWSDEAQTVADFSFTDLEVANFYNRHFINIQLNLEDFPGLDLVDDYDLKDVPSFLFLDSQGTLLHQACGPLDAAGLLQLGADAIDETRRLINYQKKYLSGEKDIDFIMEYLLLQDEICLDAEAFANEYLASTSLENLKSTQFWEVFKAYQWDVFSPQFQYVINNKELLEKEVGYDDVNDKLYNTFLAQYQEIYNSEELQEFSIKSLLSQIGEVSFVGSDTLVLMMNLYLSEVSKDWEANAKYAIDWVEMMQVNDSDYLMDLAWRFYKYVPDPEQLKRAIQWAQQSVDESPSPSAIDTYASLLYKTGQRKKAIELAKQALKMAEELAMDTKHYHYQLKKFKTK